VADLNAYLKKRGVSDEHMEAARRHTREYIDAYALREARVACVMTQMEVAAAMGVSQNRISRMENGDLASMSLDTIRRYVEALGGKLEVVAETPAGKVVLL